MLAQPAPAVALFLPRVTTHVIAVLLPKARHVRVEQRQAPNPLGALPEIQVRYEQTGGPTMFRRQPLAAPLQRDEVVRSIEIAEREVRGETLLGRHQAKRRLRLYTRVGE